ncbi:uncharacterized protein Z518_11083 [Rhinocladiella mackenziei CBS 650.93]|uniref:PAS domain-containing protein n=1 Tax=Rhinocladiella mackenziei CBS 650.93 TaxID=1442369 RepID=A0A0D2I8V0_9EURO|nr:uncharacterized protein Z518_11083 [Rhinocladiella mackenziei CBS 650.93]KIW99670.1 hypothetical protein Z518_11083 [Rhinocladiella mackenziei CBS 650.93]
MDLERIKQNLRLRSGRPKKPRKPGTVQSNTSAQLKGPDPGNVPNGTVKQPSRSTTQLIHGPAKEEPSLRNWDSYTALPEFPTQDSTRRPQTSHGLLHAATSSNIKISPPEQPSRLGRSGIERPRKAPAPAPSSDPPPPLQQTMSETDTGLALNSDTSDTLDFDLRPPAPRPKPPSVESVSESLFSPGHLNVLLRHPQYLAQFASVVAKYRPQYHPVLLRYLQTQKAIKAVEYANAVAEGSHPFAQDEKDSSDTLPSTAATLDRGFEESSTSAFRLLVDSALPVYITYNLVKLITECLTNEITGKHSPLVKDLVGGLSEVFCLTDPNQEDNPIIYASEEFYRFTGYSPDDVIGRNCRFLQGSKTKRDTVARLRESVGRGEDACETILNYRRDGRPFMNLLMIAPLHDHKGNVKYHIGAQIDVTRLLERGKVLEGFERYLTIQEIEKREREIKGDLIKGDEQGLRKPKALAKLRDLSELFDLEESAVIRSHSRSTSSAREEDDEHSGGSSRKAARRVFGTPDPSLGNEDGDTAENDDHTWRFGQSGRSGLSRKLPWVYDSYMLIRPAPSLRIVFVSPELRRHFGNIIQHPFLSHVAASIPTLAGLKESLGTGVPVSAKVSLMLNPGDRRDGTVTHPGSRSEDPGASRVCWISATPLRGSDDKIGVWMVVVVEKTKVPTTIPREDKAQATANKTSTSARPDPPKRIDIPVRSSSQRQIRSVSRSASQLDVGFAYMPLKPKRIEEVTGCANATQPTGPLVNDGNTDKRTGMRMDETPLGDGAMWQRNAVEKEDLNNSNDDDAAKRIPRRPGSEGTLIHRPEVPNDEFIRSKSRPRDLQRSQRIHIHPGSNGEPEAPSTLELDDALDQSLGDQKSTPTRRTFDSGENTMQPEGSNHFQNFSDDEATPRGAQKPEFSANTPSPSRPGTGGVDHSSGKTNGTHYMDYIRHPGSRPPSEYNRVMSGSGFLSSIYHPDDGKKDLVDGQSEDFTDLVCARSPYSVD